MGDKIIKGTKDRKRYQVIKGSQDTREIRCTNPKCKNVVRQVPDGRGGFTYKCSSCQATYNFLKI